MVKHRTHRIGFTRQVAQEFLAGETLHGLAKRHDLARNLIRVWVEKYEAGEFDEDARAAEQFAHVRLAPFAVAEQNEAWGGGLRDRKQARVVEVCGHYRSRFKQGAGDDLRVRRAVEAESGRVHRIVSAMLKPLRQFRRQRHID